jgi:3-isopropylmalate dehydratase small subunit
MMVAERKTIVRGKALCLTDNKPDSIRNRKGIAILVVGPDFGLSIALERAMQVFRWARVQVLIAPSFLTAVRNKCKVNGIVCAKLAPEHCRELAALVGVHNEPTFIDFSGGKILIGGDPEDDCNNPGWWRQWPIIAA